MYLNPTDVRNSLDEARIAAEEYKKYVFVPDATKRWIDPFLDVINEHYQLKVILQNLRFPKGAIKAMFWAMNDGSYQVFLLEGMEEKEYRFALCKELFHVLLDQPECRSTNIFGHLEEVTATFPIPTSTPNCPAQWEVLAEAAAMEFMFPFSEREQVLAACNNQPDIPAIAERYGIPELYVDGYLSPAHMEFFRAFRA